MIKHVIIRRAMARSLATAILVLGAALSVSAAQAKTVKIELTAKETDVPVDNEGNTARRLDLQWPDPRPAISCDRRRYDRIHA